MIKVLIAENFQSHKSTRMEFVEGINVIHGPSHSGKSACVRIFRSVLERKDFYIRNGESTGMSAIEFDDCSLKRLFETGQLRKCPNCKEKIESTTQQCQCGEVINRKMSSDVFILNNNVDKPYSAFGLTLPEEILSNTRIRNLKFVDIDENFNLASQFDPMFFVDKSYGGLVRNKIISSLIPDSDKVDSLIKKFSSELVSKNSELNFLEQQTEKTKDQLEFVTPLMQTLEVLNNEIEDLKLKSEKLTEDIEDLNSLKTKLEEISKKCMIVDKVKSMQNFLTGLGKKYDEAIRQKDHTIKLQKLFSAISQIKKFDGIEIKKIEMSIPPEIHETTCRISLLSKLKTRITEQNRTETTVKLQLEKVKTEIEFTKEKIGQFFADKKICPISGIEFCQECKDILSKG